MARRIQLSGGDYNGMFIRNPGETIRTDDYLLITSHQNDDQFYRVFKNGVARSVSRPERMHKDGTILLFAPGEVQA